jgi:hypothetical protein
MSETAYSLTPAYGRDYRNAREAREDFEAGKDFIDSSFGARHTYVNGPQIPKGSEVRIRYKRCTQVVTFRCGDPIPELLYVASKRKTKTRPTGYQLRVGQGYLDPHTERFDIDRYTVLTFAARYSNTADACRNARKMSGLCEHRRWVTVIPIWKDDRQVLPIYAAFRGKGHQITEQELKPTAFALHSNAMKYAGIQALNLLINHTVHQFGKSWIVTPVVSAQRDERAESVRVVKPGDGTWI